MLSPLPTTLLEQLRVRIGLDITDTSRDADLELFFSMAFTLAEKYCDRKLEYSTDSETFTHFLGYSVQLRRYPVESITLITADTEAVEAAQHTHLESGVVYFDGRTSAHVLLVEYVGGYPLDQLPADLLWAVTLLFDSLWAANANAGGGSVSGAMKQVKIGDLSISYDTGSNSQSVSSSSGGYVTGPIAAILDTYRRYSV